MDLYSSRLFEVINGTLFVACVCLLFIFGRFLWSSWKHFHSWKKFYHNSREAIALVVFISGDAIIRGPVWLSRWMVNHQYGDAAATAQDLVTLIVSGVLIALLGSWCVARVYGSKLDGLWTILLSLVLGFGLAYPW